jgi:hypothetical protein
VIRRRSLAAIAAIATLALLAGGGTAAASWNATASLAATASSTTVATALAQSGQLNTTYRYSGSTSTAATGALTITNNGGAPLTYALANQVTGSATLAQKTALILWTGTCGATIPTTGTVSTTLADRAPVLPAAAQSLAAGASVTVCVATRVTGTDASSTNAALQGQSVSAAFAVTGAVGTSWTTTASTAAITQSVYRLAAPTNVACADGNRSAVLSWSAPANRTAGAAVTYRVYDTASGADVATVTSSNATASVSIDAASVGRNGTYTLAIEAKEGTSGTTAPVSATISVLRTTIFFFFPSLECA